MKRDFLTGFFAKEELIPELRRLIYETAVKKTKSSILLIDLDHFKKINRKYGHLFGDEILKYNASVLRLTLTENKKYFRYGGDEFVVFFPGYDAKSAMNEAKMYHRNLAKRPFVLQDRLLKISASCGVASFPRDGETPEKLIQKADKAMYFSKRFGRNTTTEARRLPFLWARMVFIIFIEAILLSGVGAFLNTRFFNEAKEVIVTKSKEVVKELGVKGVIKTYDIIILKSGVEVKGNILYEDDERVSVELKLGKESRGSTVFEKSQIKKIIYRSGETSETLEGKQGFLPSGYDIIVLTTGDIIKCEIIREDDQEIEVEMQFSEGKGTTIFGKDEIVNIVRSKD